jgi:hypothetical protein
MVGRERNQTTMDLTITLREDGAPFQTLALHVPYAGQAAEASVRDA